jgi:hypothetical protein
MYQPLKVTFGRSTFVLIVWNECQLLCCLLLSCLSFLCILLLYLWSCSFLVLFSSCFLFLVLGFVWCWRSRTLSCSRVVFVLWHLTSLPVRFVTATLCCFLLCYGRSVSKIGNGVALVSCWFRLLWLCMWNVFMVFLPPHLSLHKVRPLCCRRFFVHCLSALHA